jgi:ubiquinone/menaquinone biosynthesis C-methylase UbiE
LTKAKHLVDADFSEQMLARAKEKIVDEKVEFKQIDLREELGFSDKQFDLITCSLVLEHIEDINFVFSQAQKVLRSGGHFYIGELHPFEQYKGGKARLDTDSGVFEVECFVHHVSEFFAPAKNKNFDCI